MGKTPDNAPKRGQRGWQKTQPKAVSPFLPMDLPDMERSGFVGEQSQGVDSSVEKINRMYEVFKDKNPPSESRVLNMEETEVVAEEKLEENLEDGQLPMWLTAREIRSNYQGFDNDRKSSEQGLFRDGDVALFERKLTESELQSVDGEELPLKIVVGEDGISDAVGDGWSLADDVRVNGVKYPVSLQIDFRRKGRLGKPEILGGHHRIAVMEEYRPDDLIEVRFYDDMYEAQGDLKDKY